MAEMETLAVAMCASCPSPHMHRGNHDARKWGPCEVHQEATDAALSWLASVLADDATVRTVAEALEDATIQHLGRDLGTAHRDEIAAHALAALSAHLTAPARAGDTSGEEGTGWHRHQTQGVVRDADCRCSHGVRNVPAPTPVRPVRDAGDEVGTG